MGKLIIAALEVLLRTLTSKHTTNMKHDETENSRYAQLQAVYVQHSSAYADSLSV